MAELDYSKATAEQLSAELVEKYRTEKLQEVVDTKKKAFYKARDAAFEALRAEHDVAAQALARVWQTAEDNNYTVPK